MKPTKLVNLTTENFTTEMAAEIFDKKSKEVEGPQYAPGTRRFDGLGSTLLIDNYVYEGVSVFTIWPELDQLSKHLVNN